MCLHQLGNKIAGTNIMELVGKTMKIFPAMNNNAFMIG
jgi:hypothetical protein